MNTQLWQHILPVAALSLTTWSAGAAVSDENGYSALASAIVTQPATDDDDDETFDLNFKGGTVADYTAALSRAVQANIVLIDPAGEIPLPAMQLKQVSFGTAMSLLDGFHQQVGEGEVQLRLNESWDGEGLPIYTVKASLSSHLRKNQTASAVLSLSHILRTEAFSPEDLLTAIETALALFAGDREPAQIRFHEATGLLIARGAPEQIGAIHEVINQLGESAGAAMEEREMMSPEEQEELMVRLEEAMGQNDELINKLDWQRSETRMIQRKLDDQRQSFVQVIKEREAQIFELRQQIHLLKAERKTQGPRPRQP